MNARALLTVLALGLALGPALAQGKKVYRCEVGGKVLYADAPCKDATEVAADDARTKDQREAAAEAVKREEKLADQMARERRIAEAAAASRGPVIIPHAAARAASAPASKKPAKKKPAPSQTPAQP